MSKKNGERVYHDCFKILCVLLFGGEEAGQTTAISLQDEVGTQAGGSAVAVVERMDDSKLIVNKTGDDGDCQFASLCAYKDYSTWRI